MVMKLGLVNIQHLLQSIRDSTKRYKLPVVSPGTQLRNFTHYSDIVSGLIMVALKGSGDGFGIGSDRSVSNFRHCLIAKCSPTLEFQS